MKVSRSSFSAPQHGHPANISRQGHQRPLSAHGLKSTSQELPESHHRLDDSEHGLYRLFTQTVLRTPGAGLKWVFHPLHGGCLRGQWGGLGKTVSTAAWAL